MDSKTITDESSTQTPMVFKEVLTPFKKNHDWLHFRSHILLKSEYLIYFDIYFNLKVK